MSVKSQCAVGRSVRRSECSERVRVQVVVSLNAEACIEEGEIVRESSLHDVLRGCRRVMSEVLSRLHAAACVPHLTPGGGKVGGQDLELAMGLQEGMEAWCDRLLHRLLSKDRDHEW